MENELRDSVGIRIPPPLYFFACLGFGILLEYFFPVHLISLPLIPRVIVVCIFTLISLYFAVSGFIALIKNKTPFDTAKPTVKVIISGAYRFSRNPLYVSLLLLLFGIAFFHVIDLVILHSTNLVHAFFIQRS